MNHIHETREYVYIWYVSSGCLKNQIHKSMILNYRICVLDLEKQHFEINWAWDFYMFL